MAKSIGVLTAFINADASGFFREMGKLDRQIARASSAYTKPGAKLALGFLGVQNALSAVSGEVRRVVQNIESIPGVPATATASIMTMRDNIASARGAIDRMTASMVAFGVQFAQAVGAGAAGLMGYKDTSGLSALESPDDIARARDPEFDAKVAQARKKLADSQAAAALAGMSPGAQVTQLRTEAARLQKYSTSTSLDTGQRFDAQIAAQDKLRDAAGKMADLNKQLADSEREVAKSMTGSYKATVSLDDAIAGLEARSQKLFFDLAQTSTDKNDPEAVERRIKLNHDLADTQERLGKLYERQAETGKKVGETIAGGFEDAIVAGGKLQDMLRNIAQDLFRLLVRNSITQPLANGISSMFNAAMFGGPAASGGAVDAGYTYRVNEDGQEFFKPDVGGTIIPVGASGGRGRSGEGITVVVRQSNSFQTGVTQRDLAAVLPRLVEQTKQAVADAVQRGGGYRRAMA